jgi:hypothetical protein
MVANNKVVAIQYATLFLSTLLSIVIADGCGNPDINVLSELTAYAVTVHSVRRIWDM